jgi:MFS family permease
LEVINPQNWPNHKKWIATIIISLFSFNTMMTSPMIAPALTTLMQELNISSETQTALILSAYVVSYSFGPFIFAPLSELYGRLIILQAASSWFLAWNIACGFAYSSAFLVVARWLSGIGASAALAVSASITDRRN